MNSTELDCLVSSYQHRKPSLFESHSFFYVSKVVLSLCCVSSPVSVVGNILVFLAIMRTSYLHTPDNILVGALAVNDCLVGAVVQPMSMALMIKTSDFLGSCPFVTAYTLVGFVCSNSVSLMAAISWERCMALFRPLRYSSLVTNNRAFIVALLIWFAWIVAACCSCFGGVIFTTGQILAGIVWFASCIIIGASYIKICLLVRHHRRQIHAQHEATSNTNTSTAAQTKLAVTMGYVIGISLLCYLPTSFVCQLFYTTKQPDKALFDAFYLLIAVQLMSSCLNPVIYCWRRRDIRKAVGNQLRTFCPRWCGIPVSDEVQPFGHSRHNITTTNASMRIKVQISTIDPMA